MKHVFVTALVFCTVIIPSSIVRADAFPEGADLFIEAMRYRGGNHTIIHSLSYVTEQTYCIPSFSEAEIEKKADELEDLLHRALKDNPNANYWIDGTREAVRKHHSKAILSRFTVKYKASSFSKKLLSLRIERQNEELAKWKTEMDAIEANILSQESASEGAIWFPQARSARINDIQSYMETLINFGRIQGPPVPLMQMMLLQDMDVEKHDFSEKNISMFKEEREKQFQVGQIRGLVTVGTVTYDGDAKAYIVESSANGRVIERYWIDVSRGYVCPLLQYYDENGKLISEYKSRDYFLHEKSGLWFPLVYEEMTTNRDGKQQTKEYRIDVSSVEVNFQIVDEDFSITIPEGAEVIDERRGKNVQYVATSEGFLSLGKDGLAPEKQNWLLPVNTPNKWKINYTRAFFTITGISLIILGLYFHFRRKQQPC